MSSNIEHMIESKQSIIYNMSSSSTSQNLYKRILIITFILSDFKKKRKVNMYYTGIYWNLEIIEYI